jgi:secondary thiamine-phosphate synthase enzyme
MKVFQKDFGVSSKRRNEMIDITSEVGSIVRESGISNGQVTVYCPHTTSGVTINENADPSVPHDILLTLSELIPQHRPGYRHSEGNSDSHCKSTLVGCSAHVLVKNDALDLGTWQAIFFCEFDGPRRRTVLVQVRGE